MAEINKIKWMIKKDLLTLWRHKVQFASLILFPILMIALCGWGMGGTVENTPVVVVKQSSGDVTDQVINALKADDTFDIKDIMTNSDDAKEKVDNGEVKAAIILSSDFESSNSKNAVLYIDSSDQLTTQTLVPKTEQIFASLSEKVGTQQVNANTTTNPITQTAQTIKLQVNKIYGDLDYIDFLLPGVLAMTMFMSSMMTMGNSIAGERERGELSRLFMTPTNVSSVLTGKIISQVVRELIRALVLIIAAMLLFNVMIKGNLLLLVLVILIAVLCFVGFGMMFSATAKTQEDYIQIVMPVAMPMMFICGVFFPTETMPWILQKIALFLPLTYANDAFRAVMLKGAGLGSIAFDLIVLLAFALLFFIVGIVRFNRDV
ncbi:MULTISPECIES: ABC transporter permease [Methanosphaera]|uniref:ABC-type multidrug transport system, permease protein n=2 Tax=Methanosphaera stadtmanae TaxID=2317 RepID=Q2NHM0_METST|nr:MULTISPECIES: ABC transporter permease [Methanosphaera]ABC56613.1 ABC-type multidrug transport system, permease protein [Methanosphaera stadtmanae DSM 3091]MDO5821656.1 ABC transporter permease [Methanosphaera sp.]MEE0489089.1 ABC transporter permease [Methanosphaera stadtmanae]OEC93539.1 ABC transporter permease [Methanosphaera sp. A6]RAP03678.1 ABC transporter permease [Methanosphaera stadtmanae]